MRITRDMLLKIVDDTVKQRTRPGSDVIAAYLSGSLLGDEYLLGGVTDIDLTFIHIQAPQADREITPISDPVHLDLAHYAQKDFRDTRKLRLHPWMGPTLFFCKPLYDPQHFLDFIQASVRGQFDRPDFVLRRSRQQFDHARQMWMSFYTHPNESNSPKDLLRYLRAVEHAVNALAGLSGMPLTERRLVLDFGERVTSLGRPGLLPGLIGLIGGVNARDANDIEKLLQDWHETWLAAIRFSSDLPARLHPARREYYSKAMEWMLKGEQPQAALWPLLRTWSETAELLSTEHPQRLAWQKAIEALGLQGNSFAERIQALDIYLDTVDETLDAWGQANGV